MPSDKTAASPSINGHYEDLVMLNIIDHIPEALLSASHTELYGLLGGPTLIHLDGRRKEPLFISVLLHGNEDTSFYAMQKLLTKYQGQTLPRALSIFIGNVEAAKHNQRRLDGQPDYNRVWPGCEELDIVTPEQAAMQTVYNEMKARNVFTSIDIHNNTGLNPHYGCINRLDPASMHLAALFSRTAVYFIRPKGVQSLAFSDLCPAITLECGKIGESRSIEHALEYIEANLHLSEHPKHPVASHDIDLFHTVAQVRIPPQSHFGFECDDCDLSFSKDLEYLNFRELPIGSQFGTSDSLRHLEVINEQGDPVTEQFFTLKNNEIHTRRPLMPSMLTMNQQVIRQDCLCYLMERLPLADIDVTTHHLKHTS